MFTHARVLCSLCLVALVALLAFAGPASAKRVSTTITISYSDPYFLGTLRSSRGGCKYGRTVRLFREDFDADELINIGTSDGSGRWKVHVGTPSSGSNYYVLASATGGCKQSKSAVLEF